MADTINIIELDAPAATSHLPALIALLQDAVASGASLGYWHPLSTEMAEHFWQGVIADVQAGTRLLFAALQGGEVVGSVQLEMSQRQNGPHRSNLQKLLVHRRAQRQGIGGALMQALEASALLHQRTLIYLDTLAGSHAESLYPKWGYSRVGGIPNYTREADGSYHETVFFYKILPTK